MFQPEVLVGVDWSLLVGVRRDVVDRRRIDRFEVVVLITIGVITVIIITVVIIVIHVVIIIRISIHHLLYKRFLFESHNFRFRGRSKVENQFHVLFLLLHVDISLERKHSLPEEIGGLGIHEDVGESLETQPLLAHRVGVEDVLVEIHLHEVDEVQLLLLTQLQPGEQTLRV